MALGKSLLWAAAFFFLVTWVLSIASTALQDWVYLWHPETGIHEGLWFRCWGQSTCYSNNYYLEGCRGLLNTVRAFNILTICLAFFAMVLCLTLVFFYSLWTLIWAVVLSILTMCCRVIPWTVYMGFFSQCVASEFTKGSGWSLAVAAFTMVATATLLLLLWACLRAGKAAAAATGMEVGGAAAGEKAAGGSGYPEAQVYYSAGPVGPSLAPADQPVFLQAPAPAAYSSPAYYTAYPPAVYHPGSPYSGQPVMVTV